MSTASVNIVSRKWYFGDGDSDIVNTNPVHLYAAVGAYPVTLVVTDANGCTNKIVKTINVNPLPNVNFSYTQACQGQTTFFKDLTVTKGGVISWLWKFSAADTSADPNPSHYYTNAGNYNVTLVTENIYTCFDSVTKVISVDSLPVINFSSNIACFGDSTIFSLKSQISNLKSFKWTFGEW